MERMRNYTYATFANPQPGQKRKRPREFTSCKLCRDRKVACDRARPACATCISRKCASSCTYDDANGEDTAPNESQSVPSVGTSTNGFTQQYQQTSSNSSTIGSPQNLDEMLVEYLSKKGYHLAETARQTATVSGELAATSRYGNTAEQSTGARISRLEALLEALASRVAIFESSAPAAVETQSIKNTNPYSNAILDSNHCPDSTMYIGQHSWTTVFNKDLAYLFTMRDTFSQQWSDLQSLDANFEKPRRKALWHFINFRPESNDSATTLRDLIPKEAISIEMLGRFYKTFNVVFPIVDEATFNSQVTAFWSNEASPSVAWLALFLAIIALGFQIPVSGNSAVEANHPNGRRRGRWLMGLVTQHIIKIADAARRPTLTIFQAFLVILLQEKLALDWIDGNDMTSGLLGMLSRVALTMGLHRDPSLHTSISAGDVAIRRKAFWTYVYLDFEHSLHAGTPWPLIDGDVENPKESTGWPPYMLWICRGIPLYAQVLQISHSRRADVSSERLTSLRSQLEQLQRGIAERYPDEVVAAKPLELRLVIAIQQASCKCLHERICTVIQFPLLDTTDTCARLRARTLMIESSIKMLDECTKVIELLPKIRAIYQRGWKHFAIATLRCHLYSACSITMTLLRRTADLDGEAHINSFRDHCIARITEVLRLLGSSLALSFDSIKNQFMVWAQLRTLLVQLGSSSNEIIRETAKFDPTSESGVRLIAAAQEGMETVCQLARDAIAEERNSVDPPAYLLAEEAKKPQPALPSVAASEAMLTYEPIDDWLQEFDLWTESGLGGIPGF